MNETILSSVVVLLPWVYVAIVRMRQDVPSRRFKVRRELRFVPFIAAGLVIPGWAFGMFDLGESAMYLGTALAVVFVISSFEVRLADESLQVGPFKFSRDSINRVSCSEGHLGRLASIVLKDGRRYSAPPSFWPDIEQDGCGEVDAWVNRREAARPERVGA